MTMTARLLAALLLPVGCIENGLVLPQESVESFVDLMEPEHDVQTDMFVQDFRPVDILLVVDDSSSMSDEQGKLLAFVPKMADLLTVNNVDFHIGSTTTDCALSTSCGIVSWVDNTTPNLVLSLTPLIQVGLNGSTIEQGSRALNRALTRPANVGFHRGNAALEVIIISDEADQSAAGVRNVGVYDTLNSVPADGVRVHAIVQDENVEPDWLTCNAIYGPTYVDLARAYGGEVSNVCDSDWTGVLSRISAGLLKQRTVYSLSRLPVVSSLVVLVESDCCVIDPFDVTPDPWTYDPQKNAVVFHDFPMDIIRRVVVDYEVAQ